MVVESQGGGFGSCKRLSGIWVVHTDSLGNCHITAVIFSPFPSYNYICHIVL